MKNLVVAVLFALAPFYSAAAQDRIPEVEATIQSQIEAFKVDDFPTAFSFASPMIQNLFGTPQNFGAMVQRGYPMVWRPAEVRYLEQRLIDGQLWQKIMVRDAQGQLHVLDYQMIQAPEGWQINGVQILQAPDTGA